MRAPPLTKDKTKALPQKTDPASVLAAKVFAQIAPVFVDTGTYLFGSMPVALPSGRVVAPALVAFRPPSGPHDPADVARLATLIVEVVDGPADDLAEYQALPALLDVVRVGLTRRAVVVYSQRDGWQRHAYTRGIAPVPGVGAGIAVTALYR